MMANQEEGAQAPMEAMEVEDPHGPSEISLTPAAELRRSVKSRMSVKDRIEDIEEGLRDADAPIHTLRAALLSDQALYVQFLTCVAITVMLSFAFALAPQFFALMVQVVLNAADGKSNIEKALVWETTYLMVVFFLATTRSAFIGNLHRRIMYRIDVGLAHLAERASRGECPVKAGRDAAEANGERVSRTVAWVMVQARLDMICYSFATLLCVIYMSVMSWKMGTALIITLAIGTALGFYRAHIGRVLSDLEMQLSRLVGDAASEGANGVRASTASPPDNYSYMTAELVKDSARHGALHDVMGLENEFAAKHEAVAGTQSFIVFFASLVGIYVGAHKVIAERNKYTPEELIERLFYFIASLAAALHCQNILWKLEQVLPELRVIARLHRSYTVVDSNLIDLMKQKRLMLKSVPTKIIILICTIFAIMFGWLFYLVHHGNGYGCTSLKAVCSAVPAGRSGPMAFEMQQTFSLVGGGCVLSKTGDEFLRQCAQALVNKEANAPLTGRRLTNKGVNRAGIHTVVMGMRLDCPELSMSPYIVDPVTNLRLGELREQNGLEVECKAIQRILSFDDKFNVQFPLDLAKADAEALKAFSVQTQDPVSPSVLAMGSQTDLSFRLEYTDWSGAPANFEMSLSREDVDPEAIQKRRLQEESYEGGQPRKLGVERGSCKKPIVMKAKVARSEQHVYESKVLVRIEIPEGNIVTKDTLSLQLFVGVSCRHAADSDCSQQAVMPLTVLGSDWQSGEPRDVEINVPSTLPSKAIPCSPGLQSDCIGSAVLASSGRGDFIAAFSVAVLDDADPATTEDRNFMARYVMKSAHKCEGSQHEGNLDCMVELTPEPEMSSFRLPGKHECTGPKLKQCTDDGDGGVAVPEPNYADSSRFNHIKYEHSQDQDTQGTAEWHLWISQETNSATRFAYHASADCGCYTHHGTFSLDGNNHAQVSARTYHKYCTRPTRDHYSWSTAGLGLEQFQDQCATAIVYERGQLVPPRHLSQNQEAVQASGFMTNVLPQVRTMNRQAWLGTEEIIDCNRDDIPLTIIGGAVYEEMALHDNAIGFNGGDKLNGKWAGDGTMRGRRLWFWDTHQVETPTYMWKLIVPRSLIRMQEHDYNGYIGLQPLCFWIPNTDQATRADLGEFVVSVDQLEQLLNTHGRISDNAHVAETFEWIPRNSKKKRADLNTWMKNVNNCRKAGPQESWKRELCRMQRRKMPMCGIYVDEEEAHCYEVSKKRSAWERNQDARCNEFKKNKEKILADLAKPAPSRKIGESTRACEKAVFKVCRDALCPTYNTIKKSALDCNQICSETQTRMWDTGMLECDPEKETFGDCLDELHKSLKEAGRHPALEALMREHLVKCVCVSWRDDASVDVCYEGSMGIPEGKKWCEFDGAPSWQNLLKKMEGGMSITEPVCNEKEI